MKQLEAEISRKFSKIRKGFSGKGAIDTQCRVLADTIYIRFQAEYTPLEKLLIKNTLDCKTQQEVCGALKDTLQAQIEDTLSQVFHCIDIHIKQLHSAVNLEDSCSYVLVVADRNVEKLYLKYKKELEGQANRKSGVAGQSTTKDGN